MNTNTRSKRHLVATAAICAGFATIGYGMGSSGEPSPVATTVQPTATVTATTESIVTVTATPTHAASVASPTITEWSDGVFEVGAGKDIAPGTYKVRVDDDFGCYVEQSKDASGELSSIVSNDIIDGASGYVTVTAKANYLTVSGCTLTRKGAA